MELSAQSSWHRVSFITGHPSLLAGYDLSSPWPPCLAISPNRC